MKKSVKTDLIKAKLEGLGNDGYLFRYSFKKGNLNSEVLISLMKELGFKEDDVSEQFFLRYNMINGVEEASYVKNFLKDNEIIFLLKNKKFDVEVVCFSKEDILRIRTKEKNNILKIVAKYFKFENED
jgi:hypothetical protein